MRVPTNTDAEALEARLSDPSGVKSVWDRAQPARLESVCVFHVGEYVSCMRKVSLAALGSILGAAAGEGTGEGECILYTTLAGSVGVLVPFRTRTVCLYAYVPIRVQVSEYPPLSTTSVTANTSRLLTWITCTRSRSRIDTCTY